MHASFSLVWLTIVAAFAAGEESRPIVVASKAFTESAILGEMAALLARESGHPARHREQLGNSGIVWRSLVAGEIDVYPEYTGTIARDLLKNERLLDHQAMRQELAQRGIGMTEPLGFENAYVLATLPEVAHRLRLESISDLRNHPTLQLGLGNEFTNRRDGWPGLKAHYDLPQTSEQIAAMEHSLTYHALRNGAVQVIDTYGTDAQIQKLGLRLLDDDQNFFPEYAAVFLYRLELNEEAPQFLQALRRLEGNITAEQMQSLNAAVEVDHDNVPRVAQNFLHENFAVGQYAPPPTLREKLQALAQRLWRYTWQHLVLVAASLTAAIAVAVPLGVLAAKRPRTAQPILSMAEVIQTIPGLALLVLLMPPLQAMGLPFIGATPTIAALFLYSLLPILRNTYTGLHDLPPALRESAEALGLTSWARLWRIELPMASRLILAGVKTTAVINVGYATLGGLIGAGGYGDPILQGLTRLDMVTMLEGAIPAAMLALLVKTAFELSERVVVPRGLRLKPTS